MIKLKILYQLGDPLFDKYCFSLPLKDSSFEIPKGIKSRDNANAFIDGFNDNYRFRDAFLEGWKIKIRIARTEEVDWNYLQKIKRKKLKIFFVEKPQTPSEKYKILYTFGRYESGLPDRFSAGGGAESGSDNIQLGADLTFSVESPFYYETDSDLNLLNHEADGGIDTWGSSAFSYGDASKIYGINNPNYFVSFNSLSRSQQNEYIDLCENKYQFSFADKFIKNIPHPESLTINTDNSFSATVTNNSINYYNSNNLDLSTTEKSYFNLIKLDGIMSTGEWVEVINLDTQTGVRFSWQASYNSPSSMLINTAQFGAKLVDLNVGSVVPIVDTVGNKIYSYDVPNNLFSSLAFSNNHTNRNDKKTRINVPTAESDNLSIQKNTSNNINITIKNLKIYS